MKTKIMCDECEGNGCYVEHQGGFFSNPKNILVDCYKCDGTGLLDAVDRRIKSKNKSIYGKKVC